MPQRGYLSQNYDPSAFRLGVQVMAGIQERREQAALEAQKESANQQAHEQDIELQQRNRMAALAQQHTYALQMERANANNPVKGRQDAFQNHMETYKPAQSAFLSTSDAILKNPNNYNPDDVKSIGDTVSSYTKALSEYQAPDPTDGNDPRWTDPAFGAPPIPPLIAPRPSAAVIAAQNDKLRQSQLTAESTQLGIQNKRLQTTKLRQEITKGSLSASGAQTGAPIGPNGKPLTPIQILAYNRAIGEGMGYLTSFANGDPDDNAQTKFALAATSMHAAVEALLPTDRLRGIYANIMKAYGGGNTVQEAYGAYKEMSNDEPNDPSFHTILGIMSGTGIYGAPAPTQPTQQSSSVQANFSQ